MTFKAGEIRKIGTLLLLAAGVFYFSNSAQAQTAGDTAEAVQVSPVRFDWDLNSGQERSGTINLKNYSKEIYDVELAVEDFYVSDDSTEAQFFVPDQSHPLYAYDVINWIETPPAVELKPGEGRDIAFKVRVPQDTPTGGYYGAIFFKSKVRGADEEQTEASRIIVNQRVGVLLVMAVKGKEPIRRAADLDAFVPEQKIFWDNPVKLLAKIKNSGNLHFKGAGTINIYKFGRKMNELPIDPRVMYPGRTREFKNKWVFAPWDYGYYRADLGWESEDRSIKIAGTTNFWVIPWKTTAALIGLVIVLWIIYRIFTTKFEIRKK